MIIINVENSCAAEYFCVIFDQFNASLLNKNKQINKLYTVKTFTQKYSAQLFFLHSYLGHSTETSTFVMARCLEMYFFF